LSETAREQLAVGWAILTAPSTGQLNAFTLDFATPDGNCRIALDGGGVRHFLIPIDENGDPIVPSGKQNLELVVRDLVFDGALGKYLDLSCADSSLARQFDEVILDLIEELRSSTNPRTDALNCISRWRRLFRSTFGRLSPEQRVGLYAELTVFRLALALRGDEVTAAWRGPLGAEHDFEFASGCLEVKGVGTGARFVTIHGVDQLASHDGRPLALLLAAVEVSADGETLDQLVSEICAGLEEPAPFSALVAEAGWVAGIYSNRYSASTAHLIEVTDSVPSLTPHRLVSGLLDGGIDRVRYDLSLSALYEHAVTRTVDAAVAEVVT
jgi:hypothetical protein